MVAPIKNMLDKMLLSHGTNVTRISFSDVVCSCYNSSLSEGNHNCKKCLGKGRLASHKADTLIIDTHSETLGAKETDVGIVSFETVRIYSSAPMHSGEYVLSDGEIYEVRSVYRERFMGGKIEAYIAIGVSRAECINKFKKLRLTSSKEWNSL